MYRTKPRRVAAAAALATVPLTVLGVLAWPASSEAHEIVAATTLRGPDGASVGTVRFTVSGDKTRVRAHLRAAEAVGALDAFHGFHIHANDDPANGEGCVADPAQPAATWFLSADGHLSDVGQSHGGHRGDMPSLLVNRDGSADLSFTTQRLELSDLADRVVVVHAGPDNFGNVPVGTQPDQYTANSAAAGTKTAKTGNSGDRLACGVIAIVRS